MALNYKSYCFYFSFNFCFVNVFFCFVIADFKVFIYFVPGSRKGLWTSDFDPVTKGLLLIFKKSLRIKK